MTDETLTELIEAAKLALEGLNSIEVGYRTQWGDIPEEISFDEKMCNAAIAALEAALGKLSKE
jgi:hypothetical protein